MKQRFLTLAKENQSLLGLYQNPPTFFFTNPHFVLLIHDRAFCFAVSPPLPHLLLVTPARAQSVRPTSSAGMACTYDSQQK